MDPRVALAAYRVLEQEGLVELRPRSGIYVAASAGEHGLPDTRLAAWALEVFGQGIAMGVAAPQLPERLQRCIDTVRLRAVCVECNEDQLYSICQELSDDYGLETTGILLDDIEAAERRGEVRRADLLVTTSFHAQEARQIGERLAKPWIAISLGEEIALGVMRELEHGPLYFVATDARFERKLREMWGEVPGSGNLRVLLVGQDDPGAIPRGAPTIVMKRAHRELAGHPFLERVRPIARVFSPESSRELLSFIIRTNLAAMAGRAQAPVSQERGRAPGL